jgi:hypothetical protein
MTVSQVSVSVHETLDSPAFRNDFWNVWGVSVRVVYWLLNTNGHLARSLRLEYRVIIGMDYG